MAVILTAPQLVQALNLPRAPFPRARADLWVDPLNAGMDRFGISERLHVCAFMAQVAHESARLTAVEENLMYSAAGLLKTFKKYFTPEQAAQYAKKPQAIASRVYANRYGNSDEASGDGWKYRGRGLIQNTFRRNYITIGLLLDLPLEEEPDLLLQPNHAAASAAAFWWNANLNAKANDNDVRDETRVVNGGENGLPDREELYQSFLKVIA